jgi:FAD/FMN-containing dehydrogenase
MRRWSLLDLIAHRVTIGDVSRADPLLDALIGIVGPSNVLVDPEVRAGYETDWTGRFHGSARGVVRPGDTTEVAAVLATCSAAGAPVVAQGGNTGLVGGSVPRGGEVVLSTHRLHEISIDAEQGEAIVGSGAILENLQHAARATGWDLGVDLSSRGSCTIGGMVAANAGGERVLRYGAMQEQLIGIEAALADGSVVGRVPALRKDNTGYHWHGLLAGSEGTLAVITRVHLRLVAHLTERVVVLMAVDDIADALSVCSRLRRSIDSLVALEVCFADGIDLVRNHLGLPAPFTPASPIVLLAECAQRDGDLDILVDQVGGIVESAPEVRASAVATDERTRARFWSYREGHAEAINALGIPHKLDVTLPFDRLAAFEPAVRARVAEIAPGSRLILFGHIGDGNLHVNVIGPPAGDTEIDDAVLDLVVEMGGSISAEHGIGVAKRAAFERTCPPGDLAAMHALKQALDPGAILNPGVLFSR